MAALCRHLSALPLRHVGRAVARSTTRDSSGHVNTSRTVSSPPFCSSSPLLATMRVPATFGAAAAAAARRSVAQHASAPTAAPGACWALARQQLRRHGTGGNGLPSSAAFPLLRLPLVRRLSSIRAATPAAAPGASWALARQLLRRHVTGGTGSSSSPASPLLLLRHPLVRRFSNNGASSNGAATPAGNGNDVVYFLGMIALGTAGTYFVYDKECAGKFLAFVVLWHMYVGVWHLASAFGESLALRKYGRTVQVDTIKTRVESAYSYGFSA